MKCKYHNCQNELTGRKRVFCSKKCSNIVAVNTRRKKLKQMSIDYMGGKCQICGYCKSMAALEFHHIDPDKKSFGLSVDGHTRSWDETKKELDKCMMFCANCHREQHELK